MAARRQVRKRRRQNTKSRNFKQAYAERRDSIGALFERLFDEPLQCLHLTTGIAIRGRRSWLIFAVPAGTGLHKFDLLCQDERPKSLPSRTTTSGGGREGIPSGRQKSASIDRSIPLP